MRKVSTDAEYMEQFAAQLAVVGRSGQRKLKRSRVHICGAGGAGSHMAMYLAEMGVGFISINDPQRVELENLNRIPMATVQDVGLQKVEVIRRFLQHRSHLRIEAICAPCESAVLASSYKAADVIVLCTNTISSRRTVVEAAIRFRRPVVAIGAFDAKKRLGGLIQVFRPSSERPHACPVCLLSDANEKSTGKEALLGHVFGGVAALGAQMVLRVLLGTVLDCDDNAVRIDFARFAIEPLRLKAWCSCRSCGEFRRQKEIVL